MNPALQRMPPAPVPPAIGSPNRAIPYDQSFLVTLRGEPQRVHRSTVTVSVEASFTAVSIGYGVVPEVTPINFGPRAVAGPKSFLSITIGELAAAAETAVLNSPSTSGDMPALETAFRNGIRLNSTFAQRALLNNGAAALDNTSLPQLFQLVSSQGENVPFLYALFDEGSGREFQSQPLLNIAGLGSSDGKRPFRYFAMPMTFSPRTTIRLDVTELSDFRGELHVSLHGYKVLGGEGTPTGAAARRSRRRR